MSEQLYRRCRHVSPNGRQYAYSRPGIPHQVSVGNFHSVMCHGYVRVDEPTAEISIVIQDEPKSDTDLAEILIRLLDEANDEGFDIVEVARSVDYPTRSATITIDLRKVPDGS